MCSVTVCRRTFGSLQKIKLFENAFEIICFGNFSAVFSKTPSIAANCPENWVAYWWSEVRRLHVTGMLTNNNAVPTSKWVAYGEEDEYDAKEADQS